MDDEMMEEEDGGGGGAAVPTTSTFQASKLPLPYIYYLVNQGLAPIPATNVIGETLLQVKLDLDIINRVMVPQNVVPEEGAPSE